MRRFGRWLMLFLLVLGVSGMHTLGHSAHASGSAHGAPAATDLPELDPGDVCVAVLTSTVLPAPPVLGWAAVALPPRWTTGGVRRAHGVARAPPRLSELSVMRI
ncbi:hypothetical protein [Nonomuraea typhae]|uniref:hypothetical protein n=1 Tax=Nonomuraea typhae TaxID=2603600 RepID=UPI0012FC8849|nr:hypothetical protein [Nonomuraea typhae]